jgi:methionyl-tRNA formyltransferase
MNKKVVLIAPSPYSLYSTSMLVLLERQGVEVAGIIIKKFTIGRFFSEYKRDGKRLFLKIWKKLVLKDKAYNASPGYNIIQYRSDNNIKLSSLKILKEKKIIECTDLNSTEVEVFLKEIKPDAIIFTGGGLIRKNIMELSGKGILNCHMGILPEYKGMDVVEWPVINKDFNNIGVTVHLIYKGVDTGPILGIRKIDVNNSRDFKQLRREFEPIMCDFLCDIACKYLNDEVFPQEQDKEIGKQYFIMQDKLTKKAERILEHNYVCHSKKAELN